MSVRVIDNTKAFMAKVDLAVDEALGWMARDIEIIAKVKNVPVKTGALQASIRHQQVGKKHWKVSADKVYARAQEFGSNGRQVFRHYSKPGTGPHFLKNAGDIVTRKASTYINNKLGRL